MAIKKIKAHVVNKCVLCHDNKVTDGGMLCDSCRTHIEESLKSECAPKIMKKPETMFIEFYSEWR